MLTWYDFAIILATLLLSTGIGIYFGCFGSKQSTTHEYLTGEKKMKVVPIGISVAVSHFSGVTILAIPADVFRYGAFNLWINLCAILVALISIYIYLPVFFKLQLSSAYEYLARRFDNRTKVLALCLYLFGEILYFPMLVYIPALSFSSVSGVDVNLIAFLICALCVLYTTIGGLKTVVWTDILQFAIVMISVLTFCCVGIQNSGGFESIWTTAVNGSRLEIFDFDVNPMKRDTFWTQFFGYAATMVASTVIHQTGIQKYLSVPTYSSCVWSVIYSTICKCVVTSLCVFTGLIIYATYSDCDPLTSHQIKKHDQLVLYYLTDIAGKVPGITGLFVASVLSAALSSMSSLLNSMAGIIYNDFIAKLLKRKVIQSNLVKLIVIASGFLCTCLVFVIEHLGQLLSLSLAVRGATNGPLLGMFTLGMLFPRVSSKGAFYGALLGLVSLTSLMVTTKYYEMKKLLVYPTKPLSTTGCTHIFNSTRFESSTEVPGILRISFFYYTLIEAVVTIIAGVLISMMDEEKKVDKDLISPVCHFLLPEDEKSEEGKDNKAQLLGGEKQDKTEV